MADRVSARLAAALNALPLRPGVRVLEIGPGPGAAAREILERVPGSSVVAVDRSAAAVAQMRAAMPDAIASGRLTVIEAAVEEFALLPGVPPCDFAFALRVGVLDGRHPEHEARALARIAAALKADGRLFIDGGDPLRERPLGSPERA